MTIRETLGELPSGKVVPVSVDDVGKYLRSVVFENEWHKAGKRRIEKRLDYFHDRTQRHYEQIVNNAFTNAKVRAKAKSFLPYIKVQNLMRRVVEEVSTVYSEAATRQVDGVNNNASYQRLLELPSVRINTRMRQANEYVNLVNQCLLWFHVRRHDKTPELRIMTPDVFTAVAHPNDPLRLVAIVLPVHRDGMPEDIRLPRWQVWTDHETFSLNHQNMIMSETWVEHGLGRIPGVLIHRKAPIDSLTDYDSGEDLVSAQEAVALLNLLLMKANKASVRAPYVAGDIGNTATGQPLDDEELLVFQEGIAPGTLDLRADPSSLINSIQFLIKQIAANYGIPASVFDLSYQASSGFEIELKRTGLREKRHQQIMDPWRPAETDLKDVMTSSLSGEYAFDPKGWHVDFGQWDTPQDPAQKLEVWKKRREMGLTNTELMVMSENPEFTRKQAREFILDNIAAEAQRIERLRVLQGMDAGPNTTAEDPSPQENGEKAMRFQQPRNGPPPRVQ